MLEGETQYLKQGDSFADTNSAMVLEDLIGQFLYGDKKSDDDEESEKDSNSSESEVNTESK